MVEPLEQFFFDKKMDELRQEVSLLDNKITSLQRALVLFRAFSVSQTIWLNSLIGHLRQGLSLELEQSGLVSELNNALSYLRGKLSEDAIPEDAYRDWLKYIRKRLLNIFTSQQVDSLIPSDSSWERIMGFPSLEE